MSEIFYRDLPALFAALLIGVLFVQSSVDKLTDWGSNKAWLRQHFGDTVLKPFVVVMLVTLTLLECLAGLAALAGIVAYFANGSLVFVHLASIIAALTITALFFGQRVAKDYAGAAVLVPYFLLSLALMFLSKPAVR
jgi:uncharacterized membrane protein YphA (DoxX/SURF4 family)